MTNLEKNNIEQVYNFFYEHDFLKEADNKSRIIALYNQSVEDNNLIFDKLLNEIAKITNIETMQTIKDESCCYHTAFLSFDQRKSKNELLHIAKVGNLMWMADHVPMIKLLTNKLNDKEIEFESLQEYISKEVIDEIKYNKTKYKEIYNEMLNGEVFKPALFFGPNTQKTQQICVLNEIQKLEFALKFNGLLSYKCIKDYARYLETIERTNQQQTNLKQTA